MTLLVKFATKFVFLTLPCTFYAYIYILFTVLCARNENFTVLTILPCASFAWDNLKTKVKPKEF